MVGFTTLVTALQIVHHIKELHIYVIIKIPLKHADILDDFE
jgi:hypothetical protein